MNALKDLRQKEENFIQKLNKTINKDSLKTCENFCKNDYLVEMAKEEKKLSKKYHVNPFKRTKSDVQFSNNVCKKSYCNVKCAGYPAFYNKTTKRKIKNGFHKSFTPRQLNKLKKRGALSGCFPPTRDYNIFHS
jgi:hypothetical protein